jgi:large subunit ribosomal protein L30
MAGRSAKATSGEGSITVTQTRSSIATKPKHRGTLRALGLHGIGSSNTLPDRPEIRGMIARVPHLVAVAEAAKAANAAEATAAKSTKEAR